jgi:hypothetical protein
MLLDLKQQSQYITLHCSVAQQIANNSSSANKINATCHDVIQIAHVP